MEEPAGSFRFILRSDLVTLTAFVLLSLLDRTGLEFRNADGESRMLGELVKSFHRYVSL